MKKVLVWFSGTGTSATDMIPFLDNKALLESLDAAFIFEGVGTDQMVDAKIQSEPFLGTFKKGFRYFVGKFNDQIKGYSEADNILSIDSFFSVINTIEHMEGEQIELVIGGHSRGAAVGIISFLAVLREQVLNDNDGFENSYLRKIKCIHLVAADPVSGRQPNDEVTNDFMGLGASIELETLISDIERLLYGSKTVFEVSVYAARFDARNEFAFDSRWKKFIDNQVIQHGHFHHRARLFIGGFRHSEMVQPDLKLEPLYKEKGVNPQQLLRQIIINVEHAERLQQSLRERELELMRDIKNQPVLQSRTTPTSYLDCKLYSYVAFSGKSLAELLRETPTITEINKRYLFR